MKLPWVSREQYAALAQQMADLRTDSQSIREKYDRLQEIVRERGLVPVLPAVPEPLALVPTEPGIVQMAIRDNADGDPQLARYLHSRARELKKQGHADADIAAELGKWTTTEQVG